MTTVKRMQAPVLSGATLAAATLAIETIPGLSYQLAKDADIFSLRELDDRIQMLPVAQAPLPDESWFGSEFNRVKNLDKSLTIKDLYQESRSSKLTTIADYHHAYTNKKATPSEVIEKLLAKVNEKDKTVDGTSPNHFHHIFRQHTDEVRQEAEASTKRYAAGKPLSPFDGVPVLIKDEADVKGYETRCGTSFLNKGKPALEDAETVRRLRAAGAIILGKATMDEWGWATFGINPNNGTARNPHNLEHSCGGSSSGSAGAVAAGFCPIAIGADGGGSIRIPSSFCGVFGLKATSNRISGAGGFPLAATVGVVGPICTSASDLAAAYLLLAGPDPKIPLTLRQPPVHVPRTFLKPSMRGVRVGVMRAYNAQTENAAITRALEAVEQKLKQDGAEIVEIDIAVLPHVPVAHVVTISGEMFSLNKPYWNKMLWSNRTTMAAIQHVGGNDYVIAQKVRTALIRQLQNLFSKSGEHRIDFILTPTTAITSLKLPSPPRVLHYGSSNVPAMSDAMRFVYISNFSGIPSISAPCGVDENNLPIGIQFMAEWYGEGRLLEAAKWMEERFGGAPVAKEWVGSFV